MVVRSSLSFMSGWCVISKPNSQLPRLTEVDAGDQVVILIFAEVLGLYGMIVALIMNGKAGQITEQLKGFVSLHD